MKSQIVTDIGIVQCHMGYETTKRCHDGNIPCIGSQELNTPMCQNLHLCRNVRDEMGIVREET